MQKQMEVQDVFDIARLHGASAHDIEEAVDYVFHLGSTGTRESRNRCGDLVLLGYLYERGWLT